MPTARELLEQADALMRRNRSREPEPDIPELTDEVAVAGASLAARPSAPPVRSPADDVAVPADDVPELRDAVGEIEELSIDALPVDAGEDSRWLEVDLGEASITGPAPDSIAVVPPATLRAPPAGPAAPTTHDAASAAATPTPAHSLPAAPTTTSAVLAAKVAGTLSGQPAEPPPASDPGFDAMLGMAPAEAAFEQEFTPQQASAPVMPAAPSVEAPPVAPATADAPASSVEAPPVAPAAADAPAPSVEAPPVAPAAADAPASSVEAPPDVPIVAQPAPVDDSARWAGLAEEIRMQVLQRIDIFTDTGLSGELAARLQPIVDRASVDLVTTINREVGHLLRAYVAEAIEREIEKWREDNP